MTDTWARARARVASVCSALIAEGAGKGRPRVARKRAKAALALLHAVDKAAVAMGKAAAPWPSPWEPLDGDDREEVARWHGLALASAAAFYLVVTTAVAGRAALARDIERAALFLDDMEEEACPEAIAHALHRVPDAMAAIERRTFAPLDALVATRAARAA